MTTLGKLLVLLNLFGSMVLLAWATSLTANRLDWVDRTGPNGAIKGEITLLKEEIAKASKAIAAADAEYGVRRTELVAEEKEREERKERFDQRLAKARQGSFNVQLLRDTDPRIDRRALINVNAEGPPVLDLTGKPLRGVDAIQADLSREVSESERLYRQMNGGTDGNNQPVVGLRAQFAALSKQIEDSDARIQAQRTILANLNDEDRYLGDLQVNWDEELRTLQNRVRQLQQRLQALGAGPKANSELGQ